MTNKKLIDNFLYNKSLKTTHGNNSVWTDTEHMHFWSVINDFGLDMDRLVALFPDRTRMALEAHYHLYKGNTIVLMEKISTSSNVITDTSTFTPSSSESVIIDETAQPKANQCIKQITKKEEKRNKRIACKNTNNPSSSDDDDDSVKISNQIQV
jgi:hypothetical protein